MERAGRVTSRQRVPPRALALSVLALLVPLVATLRGRGLTEYDALLWLMALIPAFLLAYYRGWSGAATALAAGMAVLGLTQVGLSLHGNGFVHWPLLLGVVVAFIGISLGIGWLSELLHRERALALQNAVDLTLVIGEAGRIQYASPSTERLLGVKATELVGQPIDHWIHPEERDRLDAFHRAAPAAQGGVEARFRHADGSWRVLDLIGQDLSMDAVVGGLVLRALDVTERKQLQEQLRLAHRMQAIAKLAAGVAHEFNNILTTVEGHTRLLLEELSPDDARRHDLDTMLRAADRGSSLTWQLLAFTRQQVLRPRQVDLNELVMRLQATLVGLVGEEVGVTTSLAPRLGSVMVDPAQLEQVVIKLVMRAAETRPGPRCVIITTENAEIDAVFAARFPYFVATGPYSVLAVGDDAPAMDEEVRRRIFEPFTHLGDSGGSTGLELSSAYGVIKQSGGYIWVDQGEAGGNTFRVYLPQAEQPQDVDVPTASAEESSQTGTETVLVVEDDAGVRSLVRRLLLTRGYSVLEASHGEEALTLVDESRVAPNLVITDIVMPGMTGRELASRLAVKRPGIPVLLVSGYVDNDSRAVGWIDSDIDFMQKPFAPAGLLNKVREMLDRAS